MWLVGLLMLNWAVVGTGYVYEPVAFSPSASRCTAATWMRGSLVLVCHDGLWLGPVENLRLVFPCVHDGGSSPKVLPWRDGVVVSCACGLFFLKSDGLRRLAFGARPGAIAVDEYRGLVVVMEGQLWHWSQPDGSRSRLHGLPAGSVVDLRWRDDVLWILRWRGSLRLSHGRLAGVEEPKGAWIFFERDGFRHWVDRRGQRWRARAGGLPVALPPMTLLPGERIERLHQMRTDLWMSSNLRWWWRRLGKAEIAGRLPAWGRSLVPVRGRASSDSSPPWLVGTQDIFRPRRVALASRPECGAKPMVPLFWPSMRWASPLHLPRVDLLYAARRGINRRDWRPDSWSWQGHKDWSAGLRLSWPLGGGGTGESQAERLQVEVDWMAEGQERNRLLAALAQIRRELCVHGAALVDLQEVDAMVAWLLLDSRQENRRGGKR